MVTEIRIERQEVPSTLLTCSPNPMPPSAGSQRDVASYIVSLWESGEDCRTKLGEVRTIVTPTQ